MSAESNSFSDAESFHGCKLESFNMTRELERGRRAAEGEEDAGFDFRIGKADDDDGVHDAWVDDLEEEEKPVGWNRMETVENEKAEVSPDAAVVALCKLLRPGESVTAALRRLAETESEIAASPAKFDLKRKRRKREVEKNSVVIE